MISPRGNVSINGPCPAGAVLQIRIFFNDDVEVGLHECWVGLGSEDCVGCKSDFPLMEASPFSMGTAFSSIVSCRPAAILQQERVTI
jgi:hypothetical protein